MLHGWALVPFVLLPFTAAYQVAPCDFNANIRIDKADAAPEQRNKLRSNRPGPYRCDNANGAIRFKSSMDHAVFKGIKQHGRFQCVFSPTGHMKSSIAPIWVLLT